MDIERIYLFCGVYTSSYEEKEESWKWILKVVY